MTDQDAFDSLFKREGISAALARSAAECQALEIAVHAEEVSKGNDAMFVIVMQQRLLDSLSVFGSHDLAKELAGIIRGL